MDLDKILNPQKHFETSKSSFSSLAQEKINKVRKMLTDKKMPTKNFDANIKTLVINVTERNSKNDFIPETYSSKRNRIYYNDPMFLEHGLIHMASKGPDSITPGIMDEKSLKYRYGLNEGITDYFNEEESQYPFEKFVASFLSLVYGEQIYVSYFENDADGFIKQFWNKEDIENLMLDLNYYHYQSIEYYKKGDYNSEKFINSFNSVLMDCINIGRKNELSSSQLKRCFSSQMQEKNMGYILEFTGNSIEKIKAMVDKSDQVKLE